MSLLPLMTLFRSLLLHVIHLILPLTPLTLLFTFTWSWGSWGQKRRRSQRQTKGQTTAPSNPHNHPSFYSSDDDYSQDMWKKDNPPFRGTEEEGGNQEDKKGGGGEERRALVWSPLPLFALFSYAHVHRRLKGPSEVPLQKWEISCYRLLPWRTMSRTWGYVNGVELPRWARVPVLSWYARTFDCCLGEAELGEDLGAYSNLGEFFRRSLKSGARPICPHSILVSPADGTLLHSGPVPSGGLVEQVKGVTYPLQAFLGPNTWSNKKVTAIPTPGCAPWEVPDLEYERALLHDPERNSLYTAVIYLAPGDYHRFHSPTNWTVTHRRHFPGELLSVNPRMARWISGLFALNERAVYVGEWTHGFFSMTAVGATNVGSIRVYSDPDLSTNGWVKGGSPWKDKSFRLLPQGDDNQEDNKDAGDQNKEEELKLRKGDPFGEFNLGSTIVLLFEAPKPRGSRGSGEEEEEEEERSGTLEYRWVQTDENKVRVGRPLHPSAPCPSSSSPTPSSRSS